MFVKNHWLIVMVVATGICLVSSITRKQMKNTSKIMKKSCMPKNNVTEDQVGNIEQGEFLEERKVMCYIKCIYAMGGAIKNDKFVYDAMIKHVNLVFPPEIKEPTLAAINQCRDVDKQYADSCEAAYWVAKCMYEYGPEQFFFP
ncbi:hypothetical protein JYU34_013629 [Plutella xylostella]|uniref:Uncharacterized protein n=3 Tax=Plutella xylostella TaxID=51655 RepID=A0ABQ7QA93_PLUXY|nr:hypothetical protein JYU34_013629 [Plutella xylostella]